MSRALLAALLALAALPAGATALSVAPVPSNPNSACAVGNPCSLDHAFQIASPGDDIAIAPGAYSLTVQRNLSGVDVHGIDGQDAPQITASNSAILVLSDGDVRHLGLVQAGTSGLQAASLGNGATLEDASLRCVNACSAVLSLSGTVSAKDAVIFGPSSLAGVDAGGSAVTLRNLTVLVNGANSRGVRAYTNGFDTTVDLRNSIVRGAGSDLAFVKAGGSVATLNYGWSDVRAGSTFLNGGSIVDLGNDVREEPIRIVDLAGGDAHLLSDSALIDAGTSDQLGAVDLDGGARVFGPAPDIGADEATFPLPTADTGDASAIATTSATLAGTVTPSGATTYRFEWGTTTAYGQATTDATAGNGSAAVPVSAAPSGLEPDTVYHYRVVATSPYGTATGIDKVLRTAAVPDPQPPAAFTGTLATTKSAKIDKQGGFFVTIVCPGSAITACTGTARLGLPLAKPRKFLAAPGNTVRLRLTLTRAGRRLVGRNGLKTNLVVLAKDGAGREHAQVRALRLQRR